MANVTIFVVSGLVDGRPHKTMSLAAVTAGGVGYVESPFSTLVGFQIVCSCHEYLIIYIDAVRS